MLDGSWCFFYLLRRVEWPGCPFTRNALIYPCDVNRFGGASCWVFFVFCYLSLSLLNVAEFRR